MKGMWLSKRKAVVTPAADAEPTASGDGLVSLGLGHLNLVQRVGLRDDVLAGYFNNDTSEVFPGFPLIDTDILVDFGCGSGGPLEFCINRVSHVFALDSDPETLNICRHRLSKDTLTSVEFIQADGRKIPLPNETATKVMCLEVLEHVDDPLETLNELVRIGKPECTYLISIPDPRSENILKTLAPPAAFEKPHHIRVIEPHDFSAMLNNAGLEVQSHSFVGGFSSVLAAIYFSRVESLGLTGVCSIRPELAFVDPAINDWAHCWNALLDLEHGTEIKRILDLIVPKSQVVVAKKALSRNSWNSVNLE